VRMTIAPPPAGSIDGRPRPNVTPPRNARVTLISVEISSDAEPA
jgi:hypothetical protein